MKKERNPLADLEAFAEQLKYLSPDQAWTALMKFYAMIPLLVVRAQKSSGADRLIDVTEVAKRLDVSEAGVYRMFKEGRLPFMLKVGRSLKCSERKLELWIERQTTD